MGEGSASDVEYPGRVPIGLPITGNNFFLVKTAKFSENYSADDDDDVVRWYRDVRADSPTERLSLLSKDDKSPGELLV